MYVYSLTINDNRLFKQKAPRKSPKSPKKTTRVERNFSYGRRHQFPDSIAARSRAR